MSLTGIRNCLSGHTKPVSVCHREGNQMTPVHAENYHSLDVCNRFMVYDSSIECIYIPSFYGHNTGQPALAGTPS